MPNHYIVPAAGQQFAPVVRRVVQIGRSVGENVGIDKSMPTPRLIVGDKTIARWHQLNAARKAADTDAAAALAQKRADAAKAAKAPTPPQEPSEPERPAEPAEVKATATPQEKPPVKKAAASRKRKSTSNK